ncbi:PTS system, fructose-specific IIA component,PTS-EI.PTSI, ptsI; phosphotransferase system, enzyme I, PtsI,PTS-HPR.FRUB, fruB, fpr; phosphocarrier protein FPr [Thermoflexales bacterium]|nr:PTS system, fructose-specific IIA component,PTS-EI.PTSI, ptsI; phosphotransferase system, enzyme I, PtsI,PTS-HPR.FRUB, fruB, fpr; phosphocarrier protein FPr [Thermoflexales bacterium]
MVNLVIVSHSPALASGVVELARAMTRQQPIAITMAAGTGDARHPLGTNAEEIRRAIEAAYSPDGVLVLMDLGSAIMSAEMALDFLPPQMRAHVRLIAAPVVEGAIAAAVQASLGGSLDEVATEAMGALAAKLDHLSHFQPQPPLKTKVTHPLSGAQDVIVTIENRLGLHARPAAQFVQTAARFKSDIFIARVSNDARHANAKSINAVASFGARQGEAIRITAVGADANEALQALQELIASKFGENGEVVAAPVAPGPEAADTIETGALIGVVASPGYAIGPAVLLHFAEPSVERKPIENAAKEWARLQTALDAVRASTESLRDQIARSANKYDAAIFDAHLLFLNDPEFLDGVQHTIETQHVNAEWAWRTAIDTSAQSFEAIDDEYLRARAADIKDIGRQVLVQLTGQAAQADLPHAGVLIAIDLAPSDTARLDRSKVLGICTERGGPTSHSAILARTLGIPAVVGLGPTIMTMTDGTTLIVDGQRGKVLTAPTPQTIDDYAGRLKDWQQARETARSASTAPAVLLDGPAIEVVANIGSTEDARVALDNGAEGVGLLRTEFLFLDRRAAPSEEEQFDAYQTIAAVMGERPVIVRTLDVGGDKPLAYLDLGREENPFLGQRAIRLCLNRPDIFKTQLRAILRATPQHNLKIMFPMIADVTEVRRARALLDEARTELLAEKAPLADRVEVGIMVEIPAAAILAHVLAPEVDFFSIGTNDLTQYTLAAERGNRAVAHLQDALHPAVLIQIRQTVQAAEAHGKWVGVCGELAGDPAAIPILIGLGVKELSMAAGSIPLAKQIIRGLTVKEAQASAAQALQLETAMAVRKLTKTA